jgi:hypothetical protein
MLAFDEHVFRGVPVSCEWGFVRVEYPRAGHPPALFLGGRSGSGTAECRVRSYRITL